ncbi:chemo-receptor protein [Salmonella bongori]|nr:chemo-receptor protein [Salmonella bongori]
MVEALSASSDVLKAQVIELQTKTDKFHLGQADDSVLLLSPPHVSSLAVASKRGKAD